MKRRGFLLGLLATPFAPKILNSKEIVTIVATDLASHRSDVTAVTVFSRSDPLTVKLWSQKLYNEVMSELVGLPPEMLGVKSIHDSYPVLSSEPHPLPDEDSQ